MPKLDWLFRPAKASATQVARNAKIDRYKPTSRYILTTSSSKLLLS
jgi:hypothetical protein